MASTAGSVPDLTSQAAHLLAAKMYSLAACVMLFYDICITFGDEVEKIWSQKFSLVTVLWFMNRYLSPLGYIVVIVSFQDPGWSKSACDRYVLYPEVLKLFTSLAIGAIFILRLYSIYGRDNRLLCCLVLILMGELCVKIWAFTDGTAVNLPPGLVGCILTGRGNSNDRFVFTWVAELVFDTIIFGLTLYRTLAIYYKHRKGCAIPLVKIMLRDGIVYFLVIFAANVVTVTLFLSLPPDLKAINASFSTLITSLMVSRLILNLRSQAHRFKPSTSFPSISPIIGTEPGKSPVTSTLVGNLGDPIVTDWWERNDNIKEVTIQKTEEDYIDVTELNVIDPSQSWSSRVLAAPATPKVVVEVTCSVEVEEEGRDADQLLSSVDTESEYSRSGGESVLGIPDENRRARNRLFPRPTSDSHKYADSQGSFHLHSDMEYTKECEGPWSPPESWRVEGVEVQDLGKLRRGRPSRRPRTS